MTLRAAWTRFVGIYRGFALLLLNTQVLLLLVVAGLMIRAEWIYQPFSRRHQAHFGDRLPALYPGLDRSEIDRLLEESWDRHYEFESHTLFRERPIAGRYFHVDPAGFRHIKDQGPWPPDPRFLNVFVIGGSTTFGYGIADHQTVPSYLQEALEGRTTPPARVYNLGRGSYYSSQERILFQKLLVAGIRPHLAVFIDGFNEYRAQDEPAFAPDLHEYFERRVPSTRRKIDWLDATRVWLADSPLLRLLRPGSIDRKPVAKGADPDRVIDRFLANKKITEGVAASFGIRTAFVWQPISGHRFDLKRHVLGERATIEAVHRTGYGRMPERARKEGFAAEIIWAEHLGEEAIPDPLYIDSVHYAPNMCQALARLIAQELEARGLLTAQRAAR
ncbi:MAG TPA: hypothetical protein VFD71_03315 [Planctomycetota bacterium]|nr:hypothetical protein [Planctomycetota bacterium]